MAGGAVVAASVLVPGLAPEAGADTATIHEYVVPTAGAHPTGIAAGPDGNVWFSERLAAMVGRITPAGAIAEFPVAGNPTAITAGPDARMWFLEPENATIGRLSPGGRLTEFPVPSLFFPQGDFEGITEGPDGTVWYTDAANLVVGHIDKTGRTKELVVSGGPFDITAGPKGAMWFTEFQQDAIGRVGPGLGQLTEFPAAPGAVLAGITTGPDGNIWFTDSGNNVIGRITPSGVMTTFPVATTGAGLADITAGPDGNVWFTESAGNRIGRITPSGAITEIHVPTPQSEPQGITAGPDGRLWFTEAAADKVASLDPASVRPPPGPCMTVTSDTVLTADVGPCDGEGILIAADNVTLDLAGHRVFARGGPRVGDFAGIHLRGVKGVTVRGGSGAGGGAAASGGGAAASGGGTAASGGGAAARGSVSGFDAGVLLDGGASGNTVTGLYVHDNFGAPDPASSLGDGIAVFHSSANRIVGNEVAHNGIYDGISVLGLGSSHNLLRDNDVHDNSDRGVSGTPGGGTGIIVNAFLEVEAIGRGESLVGNDVVHNTVHGNGSSGISNLSNIDARLERNVVRDNGSRPDNAPDDPPGNGMGIQRLFAAVHETHDVVVDNEVAGAAGNGIVVNSNENEIRRNRVSDAGVDGILVNGLGNTIVRNSASGSGVLDLSDSNDRCDSNRWFDNTWTGTVSPRCVTIGGNGPRPSGPGAAAAAPATSAATPAAGQQPVVILRRDRPPA